MSSPRTNHFGNPLITATVGSNSSIALRSKAPTSPGSTFSKNDLQNSKTTKKQQLQSAEHLFVGQHQHLYQREVLSHGTIPCSSASFQRHATMSPNTSFTEREPPSTSSQGDSSFVRPQHAPYETRIQLLGSTISTCSTIGLPSHYPGSAGHHQVNSLESSVLLQELQDFDDIFGQVQPFSSKNSLNHDNNNDNDSYKHNDDGRESFRSKIQNNYDDDDDDDDDLNVLSRTLPFRLKIQHNRNVSELSSSSLDIPTSVSPITKPDVVVRSLSTKSTSTIRSHRRSRNRAMGSKEFQNAVLKEVFDSTDLLSV